MGTSKMKQIEACHGIEMNLQLPLMVFDSTRFTIVKDIHQRPGECPEPKAGDYSSYNFTLVLTLKSNNIMIK